MHWQQITLVGVGLLGGSLGLAARKRRLASRVIGFVRRQASVAECEQAGACDKAEMNLEAAVRGSDFIILCTPLAQMRELAERMLPAIKREAVITDVGSVKGSVVSELEPLFARAGAHFVGSPPMAGAERTGVSAANAELFQKAVCAVTPTGATNADALQRVEDFWRSVGAFPIRMSAEKHDDMVSRSSHLPHVVASELANYVLSPVHPKEQGDALRQWISGYHANCGRFARDVAGHLPGQSQEPGAGVGRVHRGPAGVPARAGETGHESGGGIFHSSQATARRVVGAGVLLSFP